MKRSPLKRKSPLKAKGNGFGKKPNNTLKAHRPMRRVSAKRSKENKLYSEVRKVYLNEHPRCEVCSNNPSSEIHHRRGRWKSRLYDTAFFLAICRPCHDRIHHNPEWAYATGLMLHR